MGEVSRARDSQMKELTTSLLGAGYFFLILCASYLLKPLRDSSFLAEFHPHVKPLFNLVTLFLLFATAHLYSWAVHRVPGQRFVSSFYAVVAANLLLFRWLLPLNPQVMGAIFYFWLSTANVFLVTIFWTQINGSFVKRRHRFWYVIVGLGGGLGGAFGGKITSSLVPLIGTDNLIWAAIGLLGMAYFFSVQMAKQMRVDSFVIDEQTRIEPGTIQSLLKERYALCLFALVVIGTFVQTTFDFQLTNLVAESALHKTKDAYAIFYGDMYWQQNLLGFLAQILIGPLILLSIGPARGLYVVPILVIGSAAALIFHKDLQVMRWVMIVFSGCSYSIVQMFREQLYVPASPHVKISLKGFIDTFGFRTGDAFAAISTLVLISILGWDTVNLDYLVAGSGVLALFVLFEANRIYHRLYEKKPKIIHEAPPALPTRVRPQPSQGLA